ncbi:MAG: type IV secretion system DNA-binding domain-containing protein [Solirubrobacteraceae bacterium]
MARLAIESQAAPAVQGPTENHVQELAAMLAVALGCVALLNPGVLLGAAVAGGWLWLHRPSTAQRFACAALCIAPLLALHSFLIWGWPWRDWLLHLAPQLQVAPVDGRLALRSLYAEAMAGPAWFEAAVLAARLKSRRVHAQVRRDHRLDRRRWRAISGRRQPMLPSPQTSPLDSSVTHPPGCVRLGVDAETNQPLDLNLPADLASHVFLPGASNSGKTTTLARIVDGALANGYSVVTIDAKAGGLGSVARRLATRYAVPFNLVDPDAPDSLGYNPCTGDAASIANKLVGAFTYGPDAEIYENIAMEAVPVVVRGLQAAGEPVTLESLYAALGVRGLANIAHKLPSDDRIRNRLLDLDSGDKLGSSGRAGMQKRLGALLEGKFGDLLRLQPALEWDRAFAQQSLTHVALSTLGSNKDVELMARVVAQDLKQIAARRLRQLDHGDDLVPVLAIFDEFAALREAEQLSDLLLQAREALMPTVISTQYIPVTVSLRKACLGAGLLIVHRLEAEDAEVIATQFGTRRATEVTHQVDYGTGFSEKGSMRRVERFNVHPNELRNLQTGQAAIKSVPKRRYTIVQVYRD